MFSGGHDKTVLGVRSGDYDSAPAASDVYERTVTRGTVKADDFRVIYKSEVFPTSSFVIRNLTKEYRIWAAGQLGLSYARFVQRLEQGAKLLSRMFPPNFAWW